MKTALFAVITLLLGIVITLQARYRADTQKEIGELRDHIDSIMVHRADLDTMYWQHLEKCAFELK